MIRFSKNTKLVEFASSINVNQKVYDAKRKGEKIIVLSLGEAVFDIPLFDFNVLDASKINRYCDTQGLPGLREKIASYYSDNYLKYHKINKDNVLISAGSKMIIYLVMAAFLNPGDEIVIHEPAWLSYKDQAKIIGANVKSIPYSEPCENFDRYLSEKTKILIINNPNNPSGSVYAQNDLIEVYNICKSRNIYMIIDEAYSEFVDRKFFYSGLNLSCEMDNLIVVNSLSKNMGISGWRIGYVFSNKTVLREIIKLNQHTITCAPSILQLYLEKYFDKILECTYSQIKHISKKRNEVEILFKEYGFTLIPGSSSFYLMVNVKSTGMSSEKFSNYLFDNHGIAVVPGNSYGDSVRDFVRVSVGSESMDNIIEAVKIMSNYILFK